MLRAKVSQLRHKEFKARLRWQNIKKEELINL